MPCKPCLSKDYLILPNGNYLVTSKFLDGDWDLISCYNKVVGQVRSKPSACSPQRASELAKATALPNGRRSNRPIGLSLIPLIKGPHNFDCCSPPDRMAGTEDATIMALSAGIESLSPPREITH